MFEGNYVEATSLSDLWRDALWCCVRHGYRQEVVRGSFTGQMRLQLPYLTLRVIQPDKIEYLTPQGINPPTDAERCEAYLMHYLLADHMHGNDYTYGGYILDQFNDAVKIIRAGQGNQATIQIGNEKSIRLEHPPCLRVISWKIYDGRLNMALYFRSWDLYAGLPENLGGLHLLNKYISCDVGIPTGDIIAFSDGAHVYEHCWPVVNQMCAEKIK